MAIIVVNKYHLNGNFVGTTSIMRGSPLGNPYRIGPYTRDNAIALYREYLREKLNSKDTVVTQEIYRLARLHECGEEVRLLCCCIPQRCHGEVVRKVIMELSCS